VTAQEISDDNKKIAGHIDSLFGGDCGVTEYSTPDEQTWINVLSSPDSPDKGLISFCTIGLSDHLRRDLADPPLGVEIMGVNPHQEFADALAGAGFYAIKNGWDLEPGTLILGVVGEHLPGVTVPHLPLLNPFLWEDGQLQSLPLSGKTVAWLLGAPVTTEEMNYLRQHRFSALEDRFEEAQPDLFDLGRMSAV
jgi:hypothetical protein